MMTRILLFLCFEFTSCSWSSFLLFALTILLRESYGEDIAGTETERSENSEESEYGGSFIDDEETQVLSSSQDFSAVSECMSHYVALLSWQFSLP